MAEERVQRRLAAILAADVAGYSRLMGQDEEDTLAALTAHRTELIEPCIAEHRGRVVKTTGDGILAEFASVVDAVRCAVVFQEGMRERNADGPEDRRIQFRIGVNLGDVIVQDDDVFGDGVNVAARLEAMADTGGVCVSGDVYRQCRGKVHVQFDDLGEQQVKNIAEPIQTYRVRFDASVAKDRAARPAPLDGPSIAVLPFDNMSGDPEQAYFSDGIAEDIITDLSKLSGLVVIARNSSFAYRGKSVDVKRIARELGVGYVLEGSVRKASSRVRITAQLIDGTTAAHLWAERYDRELEDIFAIQDEITGHVVEALKVKLDVGERKRIGRLGTTNVEAYDYVLRGREMLYRFTPDTNAEAEGLFEKAIALDPSFTAPYADLAIVVFTAYLNRWNDASEANLERGFRLAQKAIGLDASSPQGHWALALAHLWRRELDQALVEAEKAVVLAPSYAEAAAVRGNILGYASRPDEAIESLERAMRLDPRPPNIWLHFLAHAHFLKGEYEEAVGLLNRRIRLLPGTDISRALLASCYGHLGRAAEAREAWAALLEINPGFSLEQRARVLPYKDPADWERVVDGLCKAGLTE